MELIPNPIQVAWKDAEATTAWGQAFGSWLGQNSQAINRVVVGLEGGLGAGKSHLSRAILQGLGVRGAIPSPTYSLLETYAQGQLPAAHMDWYRLQDPLELEMLDWEGLQRDYPLILVEWPSRLPEFLSDFDLLLSIRNQGSGRVMDIETRSPMSKGLREQFQAF